MPSRHFLRRSVASLFLVTALGTPGTAQPAAQQSAGALSTLDSVVSAELKRTGTPGAQVAVVVGGRVVYNKGFGTADIESGSPVTADMLFRVGSVSKMFTTALLTTLADEGKLDLQQPIGRIVPTLSGRVAQVTTHQLMTHNAGWLDNAVAYGRHDDLALGEQLRVVTDTMFFTAPGRVYSYSNPGFSMAGFIGEVVGGKPFGTLIQERILAPVGMTRSTFRPLMAAAWPMSQGHLKASPSAAAVVVRPVTDNVAQWPAGFLFSSAGELARFAIALMNGGMLEGKQVLPARAVEWMTTGYVRLPGREDDGTKYGYGLVIGTMNGTRLVQHGGSINGFDADVLMLPDKQFAVITTDNLSGASLSRIAPAAMKLALGLESTPNTPPAESAFTSGDKAALIGRYAMGSTSVTIAEREGVLVFRQGGGEFPLLKFGARRIGVRPPGAPGPTLLVTVMADDGKVGYLHQGGRSLARQP